MNFRIIQFLTISVLVACALSCKKVPPKSLNHGRKQSGDNGYRLVIGNNPTGYEPGKIYNCMCHVASSTCFLLEYTQLQSHRHYLSHETSIMLITVSLYYFAVFLVGSRDYSQLQQFTHFMITAEAINVETSRTTVAGPKRVGRFQLFGDSLTKFYEMCVNTVAEADDLPKTEVQVSDGIIDWQRIKKTFTSILSLSALNKQ